MIDTCLFYGNNFIFLGLKFNNKMSLNNNICRYMFLCSFDTLTRVRNFRRLIESHLIPVICVMIIVLSNFLYSFVVHKMQNKLVDLNYGVHHKLWV